MIIGCHRQSPGRPSSSKQLSELWTCDLRTRRRPAKLTCLDVNYPSMVNELGITRGAKRKHTPLSVSMEVGHPARSFWRVLSAYSGWGPNHLRECITEFGIVSSTVHVCSILFLAFSLPFSRCSRHLLWPSWGGKEYL